MLLGLSVIKLQDSKKEQWDVEMVNFIRVVWWMWDLKHFSPSESKEKKPGFVTKFCFVTEVLL